MIDLKLLMLCRRGDVELLLWEIRSQIVIVTLLSETLHSNYSVGTSDPLGCWLRVAGNHTETHEGCSVQPTWTLQEPPFF